MLEGALGGISLGKKPEMASVTGLPGRVGDRYSSPLSPTASDVTHILLSQIVMSHDLHWTLP